MTIFERFWNWISNMPPEVKTFIGLLESDEGQIAQNLVSVAVNDVKATGFTTASFVAAGKDVLAKLVAQEITEFSLQHIIAMINISAAPLALAASTATAVDSVTPTTGM